MFGGRKKASNRRDATVMFFCTEVYGPSVCFREKFVNAVDFLRNASSDLGRRHNRQNGRAGCQAGDGRFLTMLAKVQKVAQ